MNLYLLRHGIAVELGERGSARDADRPLIPKGMRKVRAVAQALKSMEPEFDVIFSSPYVRARQTAEIVASAFGVEKRLKLCEHLVPGGSLRRLIEFLNRLAPKPENVLLVGHEPSLSELTSLLVFGEPGCALTLKKAGVCMMSVSRLQPGRCASLEWLLTPKQLELMG